MATLLQLAQACRGVVVAVGGMRHFEGLRVGTTVVAGEPVSLNLATPRSLPSMHGKLKKMMRIGRTAPGVVPTWHDLNVARCLFAAAKKLRRRPKLRDRRDYIASAAAHLLLTIERCEYVRYDIMAMRREDNGDRIHVHGAGNGTFVIECLCGRSEALNINLLGPRWTCECGMSVTVEKS